MVKNIKKAIIIGISSDIGFALYESYKEKGIDVYGTYRTYNKSLEKINKENLIHLDLANTNSVKQFIICNNFCLDDWDLLVIAPGSQDPVGPFLENNFDEWAESINVNFTNQLRIIHGLINRLQNKHNYKKSTILLFAGGGTNNATFNYSAYTISKVALIKMVELLDAEIDGLNFLIVGPGWVKTKIHESTILAKEKAGDNYQKTVQKLASNELTPMADVVNCCNWLVGESENLSGRNYSVVFDKWGSDDLINFIKNNSNNYKLRRYGNDNLKKTK